ncbi:branched-chain amino acid ABC transporter ATP-binding protein [Brucella anthropi]|uniref:ABC transporter ATP-binding protein n=1 Tax=Brucella anthropi TaxID=529 RepID=UPI0039889259
MIEIETLSVRFGGIRPIDQLTAALSAPVCGLIGPNGAGKTTLLNVFSGFVRPVEGSVLIDGMPLLPLSPLQRVRAGLRRSFQTEQVVEDLTARDNLAAIADNVAATGERNRTVDHALDFIGLAAVAHRPGAGLNLFERRLVELGKCLIGKPRLILLDEPAAGLTDEEGARLRDLVLAIPDTFGAQVIVIDHDVELIRAMCSQTLVLDYGKRLALGPTETVLADPDVRRAYLGEL